MGVQITISFFMICLVLESLKSVCFSGGGPVDPSLK